jgi:hypothetical protein
LHNIKKYGHASLARQANTFRPTQVESKYISNYFQQIFNMIFYENPDAIIINFDINAVCYFLNYCKLLKWNKRIYAHLVMDGFPVYEKLQKDFVGLTE